MVIRKIYDSGIIKKVPNKGIKSFQFKYGIRQTGFLGPQTLAKMRLLWCQNIPVPKNPEQNTVTVTPTSALLGNKINIAWSYDPNYCAPGYECTQDIKRSPQGVEFYLVGADSSGGQDATYEIIKRLPERECGITATVGSQENCDYPNSNISTGNFNWGIPFPNSNKKVCPSDGFCGRKILPGKYKVRAVYFTPADQCRDNGLCQRGAGTNQDVGTLESGWFNINYPND
jgi:hypothetical protein